MGMNSSITSSIVASTVLVATIAVVVYISRMARSALRSYPRIQGM